MNKPNVECPHLWEGNEYGTECCALCGATVERKPADEITFARCDRLFGKLEVGVT